MKKFTQFVALALLSGSALAGIAVAPGAAQSPSGSVIISPALAAALGGGSVGTSVSVSSGNGSATVVAPGVVVVASPSIASSLSQTGSVATLTAAATGGVTTVGSATTYSGIVIDGQTVNITVDSAAGTVTITKV